MRFESGGVRRPRRSGRHEPLWRNLWLLLRVAEPDAYTRAVCRTNAVDNCLRKRWWRVLLVKRFVRGHRRARLLHRNVPQRHANAQHLRLLRQASVTYADFIFAHSCADSRAISFAFDRANSIADSCADVTPE